MIRVSVSNLDLFRSFQKDEDFTLDVLLAQLQRKTEPTPAMLRGHAFAIAMEKANLGDVDTLVAEGHAFVFTCDAEIEAWPRREEKQEQDYGGVVVTARCDRIRGRVVADDKTTSQFDAESYMGRYQWRYYLDMFGADEFRWHIWECKEMDYPATWCIYAHHLLKQYRYPDLHKDCQKLALEFAEFAERWLPVDFGHSAALV